MVLPSTLFTTTRDNNRMHTAPSTHVEGACRSLSTSSEESGSGGWAQVIPDEDPQEETTCSFIHLSEGSVFQSPIVPYKPLKLFALMVTVVLKGHSNAQFPFGTLHVLNANPNHSVVCSFQCFSNWVSIKGMSA